MIDLTLDFTIKSPDGKVVAEQKNFASLTLRSRVPNKEFMAKVTYDFSGLPAGDYEVTTAAKDKNSDFRLMGFGHRVYKNFDPRASIIKKACDRVLNKLGVNSPGHCVRQRRFRR